MAARTPGRLVHKVFATIEKAIPLKVTGIEFTVERKWKGGRERRVGSLIVNAGGLRWRTARRWHRRRLSWDQVAALFDE